MERKNRLRRARDFARVRNAGRSWAHPLVVLAVAPNGQLINRFGFITGKRLGGAVDRNRAKRLLREVVRLVFPHLIDGWDCVLIARPPLSDATYWQVRSAVIQLFSRAQLWRTALDDKLLTQLGEPGNPAFSGSAVL